MKFDAAVLEQVNAPLAVTEGSARCTRTTFWFVSVLYRLRRRFDADDFLYQSWAYDAHDVGATPGFHGDTAEALRSVTAPALILAPSLDLYNPVDGAKATACMLPNARYVEIPSIHGHNAAAGASTRDIDFINETIRQFLA